MTHHQTTFLDSVQAIDEFSGAKSVGRTNEIDSAKDFVSSIVESMNTCEAIFDGLLNEDSLDHGTATPAPVPVSLEPERPETEPFSHVAPTASIPTFDVLSASFLQSVVNHIARASGLSIGLLITSKSGSILQSVHCGWDASDFRTQSRILTKIAKESVWRNEPQFSSDAFASVHNTNLTEEGTVPTITEPMAEASVCLNELANVVGSSLCSIPYPLKESSGFAVFLCEATPSNQVGIASYFAQASQLWLGKTSSVNLLKLLDTWLIVWRCSWYAKVVRMAEGVCSNSRWWLLLGALVCATMFIPIPYYPRRDCVFEPETKQYLSSPIQGRIASCEVRPGDYVEKGQLMARIDDDQLRRDFATAKAEHDSALKKRDSALATRATGSIALADIEMKQAERRIESIQDQLRRLEIRATSAGVVVQGDWQRNVGMPLTLGQSLFEVAELESMTAEVRLLASDLSQINVGDEVSVRSDASGIASFRGKISRIEPRATVIEDAAVFVADVVIHDPDLKLRPGMKAQAQIQAGWRSIGWYLFNRPTQWLANQWIW
jgi:hypothetical protein